MHKKISFKKICEVCEKEFEFEARPESKRSTCSKKCASKLMTNSRKESGSYASSDEQRKKISATLKEKYAAGWNPNTDEHREKLSRQMKERWIDGTMAEKTKETSLKRYGVEHWTKSEDGKKSSSNLHKGRKHSDSIRRRMSISASNRVRNKRETLYTSAKGGRREDLNGAYFRSCWEANFARILNHLGKEWKYEPESFIFESGSTYTPDFLCEGKYYELKGRMTDSCKEKLCMMSKEYPEVSITIIDSAKYRELVLQYKSLIPQWEGK
jgi:hypothetical protein